MHCDPDRDTPFPFLDGLPDPPFVIAKFACPGNVVFVLFCFVSFCFCFSGLLMGKNTVSLDFLFSIGCMVCSSSTSRFGVP